MEWKARRRRSASFLGYGCFSGFLVGVVEGYPGGLGWCVQCTELKRGLALGEAKSLKGWFARPV